MDTLTIDSLQITINGAAKNATDGIDRLTRALQSINRYVSSSRLAELGDQFKSLSSASSGLVLAAKNLDIFRGHLENLSKLSGNLSAKKISDFVTAINKLNEIRVSQEALSGLSELANAMSSIASFSQAMSQIPDFRENARNFVHGLRDLQDGINDFEIDDSAIEALERFSNAAQSISALSEDIRGLADALNGIPDNINHIARSFRTTGREASKAHKVSNKFIRSLGRVAFYRAIRTAFSAITNAIKTGYENLVQYSKAVYSVDSANTSQTANKYATSFLMLKNSIGAAAGQIAVAFLPMIQKLVAWCIQGANAVNQLIAALSGKVLYTRAVEYAVEYGDAMAEVGDNVSGVGGAVKELKRELLGFDELNVLSGESGGGGGGGGSVQTPATDLNQMFEEAEIDQKFLDIVNKVEEIKAVFTSILPIIKGIGAGVLLWKVSDGFAKVVSFLSQHLSGGAAGVITMTLGIAIGGLASYDAGKNGMSLTNISAAVGGMLASAIGGYLVGGVPGLAVGVGISLVVDVIAFVLGKAKAKWENWAENSEIMQAVRDLEERISNSIKSSSSIIKAVGDISYEVNQLNSGKIKLAKDLVSEIYTLAENGGSVAEISSKIKILNDLKLDGITLHFDELSGKVSETRNEIEVQILALDREYRMEALRSSLIELYSLQYDAEYNLSEAQANLTESTSVLQNATEAYRSAADRRKKIDEEVENLIVLGATYNIDYSETIADLRREQALLSDELPNLKKQQEEANSAFQDAQTALSSAQDAYNAASTKADVYKTKLGELGMEYDNFVRKLNKEVKFPELKIKVGYDLSQIEKATFSTQQIANGRFKVQAMTFANGGFPEDGLFFANHNELVGKFSNGKTAVANNAEIVSGVADGVYRAVMAANAGNGGSISVNVDGQRLFDFVVSKNNDAVRRTGKSPMLV